MPDADVWSIVMVIVTGVVASPLLFGMFLMGVEFVIEELDRLAYSIRRMRERHGE